MITELNIHMKTLKPNVGNSTNLYGILSDTGGYVISKEALRRFGERNDSVCLDDGAVEDVDFAKCMQTLGVVTGDSRDALNRSRFHCFPPSTHMQGAYPKWYRFYDKYDAQKVHALNLVQTNREKTSKTR